MAQQIKVGTVLKLHGRELTVTAADVYLSHLSPGKMGVEIAYTLSDNGEHGAALGDSIARAIVDGDMVLVQQ